MSWSCVPRCAFPVAAVIVAAALTSWTSAAIAQFVSRDHATIRASSLTLAAPTGLTATTTDNCATISVQWDAVPAADSYRLEVALDAGAWTDLQTQAATSLIDTNGYAGTTVTYRIRSRDSLSGWESQASTDTSPMAC